MKKDKEKKRIFKIKNKTISTIDKCWGTQSSWAEKQLEFMKKIYGEDVVEENENQATIRTNNRV
jgi:hypothetical protein